MKEERTRVMVTATAMSGATESSTRRRERKRTGSNDYLVRRQRPTNAK